MPVRLDKPDKPGDSKNKLIPLVELVFLWVLTIFMLLAGLAFFPSISSVCLFAFVAVCVPIGKVQAFWEKLQVKGTIKAMVLVVLFVLSVLVFHRAGV